VLLAIECATPAGSVALWHDGELVSRDCPSGSHHHSQTLLPLASELLAEAGVTAAALDGVAYGSGPGAFTGLRMACGIAQGVAVAHDLPVYSVSSLAALAWGSGASTVVSLIDARMGEVYAGVYQRTQTGMTQLGKTRLAPPENIAGSVFQRPGTGEHLPLVCGNALRAYPLLQNAAQERGLRCDAGKIPHARAVAEIAMLGELEALDPAQALPCYVRNKVAKTTAERLAEGGRN